MKLLQMGQFRNFAGINLRDGGEFPLNDAIFMGIFNIFNQCFASDLNDTISWVTSASGIENAILPVMNIPVGAPKNAKSLKLYL